MKTKCLLLNLLSILLTQQGFANTPDEIFKSSEILDITITAPFSQIDQARDKDQEYNNVDITYLDNSGKSVSLKVTLSVRGNNRLRKDVCDYSQLWINFNKNETQGTLFENQNKIKLVVQCRKNRGYDQYIVKEQKAYQLFNHISEYSFLTRLAKVNYIDSENPKKSRTHVAFFIEHQKRLADRLEMQRVNANKVPLRELNKQQSNLVDIFMFLLGNTDYSLINSPEGSCCHNSKLLQSQTGEYFPIPYDFDSSGFVNTRYSYPNSTIPISRNTQRYYRGFCQPENILLASLETFSQQRYTLESSINESTNLLQRTKESAIKYIDNFYKVIEDQTKLNSRVIERCRG